MWRIEETITIDRDPEAVFAFINDPANDALWQSSTQSSSLEEGDEVRVGSRIRTAGRFLGRTFETVVEVTQYDPPKRSAVKAVEGPFTYTGSYTVEPAPDGCRFTLAGEATSYGGLFGKISDPLVTKIAARNFRSDLETLKLLMEEGAEQHL